jgi:hypothetical protein
MERFGIMGGGTTMRTGAPEFGERFRIDGGDGDQAFFSQPQILRLTEAAWFPSRVRRGEALLFVVEGGQNSGEYIALTTRVMASLVDQIRDHGWASGVVHRIRNPTPSFDGSERDADPIGMAFIERL